MKSDWFLSKHMILFLMKRSSSCRRSLFLSVSYWIQSKTFHERLFFLKILFYRCMSRDSRDSIWPMVFTVPLQFFLLWFGHIRAVYLVTMLLVSSNLQIVPKGIFQFLHQYHLEIDDMPLWNCPILYTLPMVIFA